MVTDRGTGKKRKHVRVRSSSVEDFSKNMCRESEKLLLSPFSSEEDRESSQMKNDNVLGGERQGKRRKHKRVLQYQGERASQDTEADNSDDEMIDILQLLWEKRKRRENYHEHHQHQQQQLQQQEQAKQKEREALAMTSKKDAYDGIESGSNDDRNAEDVVLQDTSETVSSTSTSTALPPLKRKHRRNILELLPPRDHEKVWWRDIVHPGIRVDHNPQQQQQHMPQQQYPSMVTTQPYNIKNEKSFDWQVEELSGIGFREEESWGSGMQIDERKGEDELTSPNRRRVEENDERRKAESLARLKTEFRTLPRLGNSDHESVREGGREPRIQSQLQLQAIPMTSKSSIYLEDKDEPVNEKDDKGDDPSVSTPALLPSASLFGGLSTSRARRVLSLLASE